MPRQAQLNVRSAFARARVRELARLTGLTAAQVVEDALRAYVPPIESCPTGALVRRGRILVLPSADRTISLDEADAALDAIREGERDA